MGENGGGGGVAGCSSIDGASIGAGGITLSAGAAGGAGGDGGNISLTQKANIVTSGAGANAVLIQSIGGGGGFISSIGSSIAAPLMVGATDGATGDGGAVMVATHGILQTSGAGSVRQHIQSITGGGGAAGVLVADDGS